MCGLVGIASTKPEAGNKLILAELMVLSTFRGTHSSGIASFSSDGTGDTEIMKTVGTPFNIFETKSYGDSSTAFKNVQIGHTRHTTRGTTCYHNAHPFEYGDIVGAHNGTLLNDHDLLKEVTNKFGLNTDSQVLFSHIAEHGVRETIPKTRGAWALTFYDKFDEIMYFVNNGERPLWHCFNKNKTTMYWASEYEMLEYVLKSRRKIEVWTDEEGFGFFPFEENVLYGFDVNRPKAFNDVKPIEQTVYEELKGATGYQSMVSTPFLQQAAKAGSRILDSLIGEKVETEKPTIHLLPPPILPSEKSESDSTETSSKACPTEESSTTSRTRKPLLKLATTNNDDSLDDSLLYGPDGKLLFSNEFDDLVDGGCLWCRDPILEEEAGYIAWLEDKDKEGKVTFTHVLCPSCAKEGSEAMDNLRWIIGVNGTVTHPLVQLEGEKIPVKKAM